MRYAVILLALFVMGCASLGMTVDDQLSKTDAVRLPADVVGPVRQWVRTHRFVCPGGSGIAYVVGKVNLATGEAVGVVRCE